MLPQTTPTSKTGQELIQLSSSSKTLLNFWQWSASDLLSNATRGILAEYLVAAALGVDQGARAEWDAYDLDYSGIKIEVKSAAYLQSWHQSGLSKISFKINPTRKWDESTNKRGAEIKRWSDLYVFCLLDHKDQSTVDPLNLDQWKCYVLPSNVLDRKKPDQKTITLGSLLKLSPVECGLEDLYEVVQMLFPYSTKSSSQEKNLPGVLYKYRSCTDPNHLRFLFEGEFYFASPASFNDPFDCKVNYDFINMSYDEREKYLVEMAERNWEEYFQGFESIESMKEHFRKRMLTIEKFQEEFHLLKEGDTDKAFGVFSATFKWDNVVMWGNYAANNSGFVLGFDREALQYSLQQGFVNYYKSYPSYKANTNYGSRELNTRFFSKAAPWSYEREYRFIDLIEGIDYGQPRNREIPIDFIKEVILGVSVLPWHKAVIYAFCRKKKINLFQAKKRLAAFAYDRKALLDFSNN